MLGKIIEGNQRKCYTARSAKLQFYVDFSSGSPVVANQDIVVVNNGNVYTVEITKPYDSVYHIDNQIVVNSAPTAANVSTIQNTRPTVGINTYFNGLGKGNSVRFNFVYQNIATGVVSAVPNNVGIYFELVVQNSTFGY